MTSMINRILAPAKAIQIWYNVKTGYDPINFACQLENVPLGLKSNNLQYNTLVRWFALTNDLLTKRLMFQALFLYSFL